MIARSNLRHRNCCTGAWQVLRWIHSVWHRRRAYILGITLLLFVTWYGGGEPPLCQPEQVGTTSSKRQPSFCWMPKDCSDPKLHSIMNGLITYKYSIECNGITRLIYRLTTRNRCEIALLGLECAVLKSTSHPNRFVFVPCICYSLTFIRDGVAHWKSKCSCIPAT